VEVSVEFEPSEKEQFEFVSSLVEAVPELQPIWDTFAVEWDEFLPSTLMYDLARGMVALAQEVQASGKESSATALARAYACIEKGLAEPPPSPIPELVRITWGDWLGRQAMEPALYAVLCESMGPSMRGALAPMTKSQPTKVWSSASCTLPLAEPSSETLELELLHRGVWSFALLRIPATNRMFLNVLCGTVGVYGVTIELNPEELADLRQQGKNVVEEWARKITQRPTSVRARQVKLPKTWKWSAIKPGLWQSMEQTETDYKLWAENKGVVFENEALPEGVNASAWGWRMKDKRPYQLWVVMKSDPMDVVGVEKRIEALSEWSSQVHKARAGWTSFLQKPLRLCVLVLTTSVQQEQRDWVWGVDYFQRHRGLIRHVFLVDHSTGQVYRQQNVSKLEKVASQQEGMDAVYQSLESYMKRRLSDDGGAQLSL
jgi:hypothetical protein